MTDQTQCQSIYDAKAWPNTWDEDRCLNFAQSVSGYGVVPANFPVMAHELEKLSFELNGKLSIDVLIESLQCYLSECQDIADRIGRIHLKQIDSLGWLNVILANLAVHRYDPLVASLVKLVCLIVMAIPLMLAALPFRLYYRFRIWWEYRKIEPTFRGWLHHRRGWALPTPAK